MAKNEDYTKNYKKYQYTSLNGSDSWGNFNDQPGSIVEGFLKSQLEDSVVNFEYNNSGGEFTLYGYNAFGETVCSTKVVNADPSYSVACEFLNIIVNNKEFTGNESSVQINKAGDLNIKTSFKFVVTGNIAGNDFNDTSAQQVTFGWYNDAECTQLDRTLPIQNNTINPGEIVTVSLNDMFKYAFTNKYLGLEYQTKTQSGIQTQRVAFGSKLTLKALVLSYSGGYLLRSNIISGLDLVGLEADESISDYYYSYYLDGAADSNKDIKKITNNKTLELPNLSEGIHNLFIRIQNSDSDTDASLVSNDLQVSFIYQKETNSQLSTAVALVTAVPDYINNCDTSRLFQLVTTEYLQGNIRVVVLKSNRLGNIAIINSIEQAINSEYVFKDITLNLNITDKSQAINYNSYIEVESASTEYIRVLTSNGQQTVASTFYKRSTASTINSFGYKTIEVVNPKNGTSHLTAIKGAILDFSQINNGNVFTDLNPNMDSSDGFQLETENNTSISVFKVSPIDKVFSAPKRLVNSANTSLNKGPFSIEMVIKTYNCSDLNDEILSIGNIKLCPKQLFVYRANEGLGTDPTLIRNASRADFQKNKKQHITITFDPNYKPSTYLNLYDKFLSVDDITYSKNAEAYPCLKIYVNGTINRTIRLTSDDLESDGFNLQIHPSNSNINFYAFKTYDKALSHYEIRQNVISQMLTLSEKEAFYEFNDILYNEDDFVAGHDKQNLLGTISLGKCINKFKSIGNPKQYINRRVLLLALPEGTLPPYYGNRKDKESVATILVNYPGDNEHSGRLSPQNIEEGKGTVKAQGSSAKKYLWMHNVSYSKFIFTPESQWDLEEPQTYRYYKMPSDDKTEITKLVGKVNVASSMQSHKQGATKMFHNCYVDPTSGFDTTWMNGGRKAVLEDDFLYFYVNVPKEDLDKLTWDYFKDENGEYNFENCYFVGFQTWGSAKGDKATSGYDDNTPYYVMLEGADNANAAANFKVPWAAMQCWKDTTDVKSSFEQFSGKDADGKFDYLTNLLINDETIVYDPGIEKENSTDKRAEAWDVDFGITEGTKYDEDTNPVYEFEEKAKVSLNRFAEFYNLIYKYDFSSFVFIPANTTIILDSEQGIKDSNGKKLGETYNKIVFGDDCFVKLASDSAVTAVAPGDIYRYDKLWSSEIVGAPQKSKWVPAGLTYTNGTWDTLNIYDLCNEYSLAKEGFFALSDYDDLRAKQGESNFKFYRGREDNPTKWKHQPYDQNADYWNTYIQILAEAFKIIVREYTDYKDIAYHQAFMKFISGTDNRAKNTYFQIVGPIAPAEDYEITPENLRKDFKIRLYQDDLDTIFATDNNGQQIKPYYLLEPMYNKDLEHLWGDLHSGFFYNVDLVYTEEIKDALKKILDFASGGLWPDNENSNIYKYFLSIQKNFPAIAYNHQSEIYYEAAETVFQNGTGTAFYNSLSRSSKSKNWVDFSNNQVYNPLSLSHGSCYDAEVEFLKDRLLLLSTYTNSGKPTTDTAINLKGGSQESGSEFYHLILNYTSFIQYIYPTILGRHMEKDESFLNFDPIINKLSANKLDVVYNIAVPNKEHQLELQISLTGLTTSLKWENTDLYKTVFIEQGLNEVAEFLRFPNASTVICTDSQYLVTTGASQQIDVSDYMPAIEHLVLQNATVNSLGFNLSNCNRLKTLVLGTTTNNKTDDPNPTKDSEYYALKITDVLNPAKSVTLYQNEGCKGFTQLVLPSSNTLEYINIPICVKILNMGYYPNLNTFECNNGTKITDLVIDGRNSEEFINKIIYNYLSTQDGSTVYIVNIPDEGIWLEEKTCVLLAAVDNVHVNGIIHIGKNGVLSEIEFTTKKLLVEKFGNIDSSSNYIKFNYAVKNTRNISASITGTIQDSGYAPVNLKIDGNDIPIENNLLKIKYELTDTNGETSSIENVSIDTDTGYLTIESGHEGTYLINTTVYYGSTSKTLTTTVTIGFYQPKVGDFAYANGTFSSVFDTSLDLIGIVYYSEAEADVQNTYDVRILSSEVVSDVLGPCRGLYEGNGFDSYYNRQKFYQDYLKALFGTDNVNSYYAEPKNAEIANNAYSAASGTIEAETPELSALKNKVKQSGEEYKHQLEYIKLANAYINKLNLDVELSESINKEDIDKFSEVYNTIQNLSQVTINSSTTYTQQQVGSFIYNLYPAALKTLYFKPSVPLSGIGVEWYDIGNWHIPNSHDLSLLMHYRINSSISNTTNSYANWTATSWVNNNRTSNVFNSTAFSNIAYLKSGDPLISSECNSEGIAYHYGYNIDYYNSPPSWASDISWASLVGSRDQTVKIFPCCRIQLTKK